MLLRDQVWSGAKIGDRAGPKKKDRALPACTIREAGPSCLNRTIGPPSSPQTVWAETVGTAWIASVPPELGPDNVSPDDQRFVMLRIGEEGTDDAELILVENFFEELKELASN